MVNVQPLLSESELAGARRLLFMSHLAIGDFVYHGPFLSALKNKYPQLELDIWFDDCRERKKNWHGERNQALTQWISTVECVSQVFPIATSTEERHTFIQQAQERDYDIIVYIATLRPTKYARVARQISSSATLVGNRPASVWERLKNYQTLAKLDASFDIEQTNQNRHKSEQILDRIRRRYEICFGPLELAVQNQYGLPIPVPETSQVEVNNWLNSQEENRSLNRIFINPLSTSKRRDLSPKTLIYLVQAIATNYPNWHIIISVPPSAETATKTLLANVNVEQTKVSVFTASKDFFTLPAMICASDFVITVETAIMHFASTLDVPQLSIIREQAATWRPKRYSELYWCKGGINDVSGEELAPTAIDAMAKALLKP